MNKYTVVKKVIAKSLNDAIKKEKKIAPSEVFQDYTYVHIEEKKRYKPF